MKHIQGPDFPTGATIMGTDGIYKAYTTGRGSIMVRGKVDVEENKKGRENIIITEIPYQVNKAVFISRIAELVNSKVIEGISEIRDESDRTGMRDRYRHEKGRQYQHYHQPAVQAYGPPDIFWRHPAGPGG